MFCLAWVYVGENGTEIDTFFNGAYGALIKYCWIGLLQSYGFYIEMHNRKHPLASGYQLGQTK